MLANWKTTLAGALAAGINTLVAALTSGVTFENAAVSAGLFVIGLLAKDFDTTGVGNGATKVGS